MEAPTDDGAVEAGPGHNLTKLKKIAGPYFKRLDTLHSEKESEVGKYNSDIKDQYKELADQAGVPVKVVRQFYQDDRRSRRLSEMLNEWKEADRDAYIALEASFGPESGFGQWAKLQAED